MTTKSKISHLSALGLAMALGLTACGGESQADNTITLQYAFFAPAGTYPGVQMQKWSEEMTERTDGAVTVETFPGGTLLKSGDIFSGVSSGIVDVGLDQPSLDVGQFPLSSAVMLPLGFENSQQASAAYLDLLLEYEPEAFEDYVIITAFTGEPGHFQSRLPITSMDDLSGQTVRGSGAHLPLLQDMGASPVSLPMSDVAENLGTGVLDANLSSREVLQDFSLAEHLGYVTDYPIGTAGTFVAVMDKNRFANLPEDIQEEILSLREEMSDFASEYHDIENVGGAMEWAADQGVETVDVHPDEVSKWDDVMAKTVDKWIEEHQNESFDPEEVVEHLTEFQSE